MTRAGMRRLGWAGLFLAVLPFLAGCKGFWDAPVTTTSFSLTSSPSSLTVSPGATSGNTSTITVTPSNSFTGTVDLNCTVSGPSGATSPATCSLSPTSVDISSTSAMTATLTATTASSTTAGGYSITVTGSSSGVSATTSVCAVVGSGTCSSTASSSGVFYILTSSSIAGYTINSGALTPISGGSYSNLIEASTIAIAPSGNFLYVASLGSGIVPYTITPSTGALTQGNPFGDAEVGALQIDPSGKWLIDASLNGTLIVYPITSSGALASQTLPQPVSLASNTIYQMAVSSNLISVALGGTGTESFSFNANALNASPIGAEINVENPYGPAGQGAAISVAIDPQSRLLYVGELAVLPAPNSGALRVFTIGTNDQLTELKNSAGTPYDPVGLGPHAILPDPTGSYVYVASWQTGLPGAITGYSVTTSALTQIGSSTVATGTQPIGLAEDSTESYVFAINGSGSPSFNAYTFDSTTLGLLDPATISGSPAGTPIAIVAVPVSLK